MSEAAAASLARGRGETTLRNRQESGVLVLALFELVRRAASHEEYVEWFVKLGNDLLVLLRDKTSPSVTLPPSVDLALLKVAERTGLPFSVVIEGSAPSPKKQKRE
mmetsp:Transcript_14197/g.32999  ORF Transcript_14197/g.32999 Transcript_14197/m.32999 type:complete len:106 (-) Transcript_14197:139-456(-)|eukprot:CAMPEP_0182581476 /NCGR_PEP_ID=MMETSP1324-20130603/50092_1 /TAXON_ID=236786 /ORGANISM="Florenciella sp., Strain RCC1587" /LENGTH=105 /DNA_ID=CAMNT_0024797843 /DNA_START=7 /DNA_END=324 /DNA_ORIENTATION=-